MDWREAVHNAIDRYTLRHGARAFTRQGLLDEELAQITGDTNSLGATPEQTLSRILQEMRDDGEVEFVDNDGSYRRL